MEYNPGFEPLERFMQGLPYFDLESRTFSDRSEGYKGGVPLAYDAQRRRLYLDPTDTHTIVFGATGSLKTRSVVSPCIKVLGAAGESMIINDPKGELFTRHAGDLKRQGFDIVEINFRNPAVGNAWNPLYIPYQYYLDGDFDKAAELANDIANNLMVVNRSNDDPFWDYSACDLLFGLIMLTFRYCSDHRTPMEAVNIGSLLKLRRTLFGGTCPAKDTLLWKYAAEDELVAASLSGSVYAPRDTMNSILSVFDQKMRAFTIQPTLLDMLANNDFDLAEVGRRKTAVFLITPDEKTSYHILVSLFVKQSYEYLICQATTRAENRMALRIHYLLDEFSSLPTISDMPVMIAAARSRDIRFLLVVQSKGALRQRYGDDADAILSNCVNWIFFTSRELPLLQELSALCGDQQSGKPNISVYDLQHFSKQRREALVLAGRMKPVRVKMIDVDQWGDPYYVQLEHEVHQRRPRVQMDFALRDDLWRKYVPERSTQPAMSSDPFAMRGPLLGSDETRKPAAPAAEMDIDEIIRRIDQKIAELEAEEKAEAAKKNETEGGAQDGE